MRLKPGAIRELHWHALAAEWAYVIKGRCRATVIAPNGQAEIAEFIPGERGISHAGMDTLCKDSDPANVTSYWASTADTSLSSAPSALRIGLLTQIRPLLAASESATFALTEFPKKELYIGPGAVPNWPWKISGIPNWSPASHRINTAWIKPPPGYSRVARSESCPRKSFLSRPQ